MAPAVPQGDSSSGGGSSSSTNGSEQSDSEAAESTAISGINRNVNKTVDGSRNTTTIRHQVGNQFSNISDLINDNLIVVRYATVSTVLLLGIYGGKK